MTGVATRPAEGATPYLLDRNAYRRRDVTERVFCKLKNGRGSSVPAHLNFCIGARPPWHGGYGVDSGSPDPALVGPLPAPLGHF